MAEQRLLDSIYLSDLPARQYHNLLDVAQLAIRHSTADALFPALAILLRDVLNFEFVILGLYEPSNESISLEIWKAGQTQKESQSIQVHACLSGWVWKNQRSICVQDLDTEPELSVFLNSLRQLRVRTYYVFPLTTRRRRLGAIGFGSLNVVPEANPACESLRRVAAVIAQFLDAAQPDAGLTAETDPIQITADVSPEPKQAPQDFDLGVSSIREEGFCEIVGNSAPLQELLKEVRTVAATNATVLLLGETGTGKGLLARAIHHLSTRADSKFVSVNCTAIPTELLESELFGHEKGAFTGAVNRRVGRLELADGGTLLLDEVGDLPSAIQPKLLRVLQDKEFERLGSNQTLKVDVRLIAATNHDLRHSIAEGRFREDLFYRLNVFPIHVPPLRDRKSDIPALVRHLVSRYAREANKSIETVRAEAMDALVNWGWPGNIRELENLIQRCVILTNSSVLRVPLSELKRDATRSSGKMSQEAERELILQALKDADGVIGGVSGAADRLRMKRTTLYSKMKRLNIGPVDSQDR
jgi:formate hydrogenlyase transcriptional activator